MRFLFIHIKLFEPRERSKLSEAKRCPLQAFFHPVTTLLSTSPSPIRALIIRCVDYHDKGCIRRDYHDKGCIRRNHPDKYPGCFQKKSVREGRQAVSKVARSPRNQPRCLVRMAKSFRRVDGPWSVHMELELEKTKEGERGGEGGRDRDGESEAERARANAKATASYANASCVARLAGSDVFWYVH